MVRREGFQAAMEFLDVQDGVDTAGVRQFFQLTFLHQLQREFAAAVLAINSVAGDAKGPRPEFAGIPQTGQPLVNSQPDFLGHILHQVWRCLHHLSCKEKQARSVKVQQLLKSQFVADLASENERLLIKLLRIRGHVRFTVYVPARNQKVQSFARFALGARGKGKLAELLLDERAVLKRQSSLMARLPSHLIRLMITPFFQRLFSDPEGQWGYIDDNDIDERQRRPQLLVAANTTSPPRLLDAQNHIKPFTVALTVKRDVESDELNTRPGIV